MRSSTQSCSFAYKVVWADDRFSKPIFVLGVKTLLMNLLNQFLKSMNTANKGEKAL